MRSFDEPGDGRARPAAYQAPAWVRALERGADRAMGWLRDDRRCWALLAVAIAVYAALDLHVTRGTTIFVDEANIFAVDRGLHPSALLAPLNGHLVLVERLIYAVDFKLFGAEWVPVRLAQVVGASAAVVCAFELARRRIGGAAALAPAVLLLFFGSAWELVFVPSGIGNVYAVAAALGAFLALDRGDRRGDLVACGLLVVAVASFTLGAAFAVGALLLVALEPGARRRVWLALVPIGLYLVWLAWIRLQYLPDHPGAQNLRLVNLLLAPNFMANAADALAGAVAGLNYPFTTKSFFSVFATDSPYGPVLAALAAAALVLRLRRPGTPLLWGALTALLVFWVELALGFGTGRNPTVARYVYGGAVLVLVIAAEAVRGARPSNRALLAVYLLVGCALLTNVARLREGVSYFRTASIALRGELTALEIARDQVRPDYVNPANALQVVQAGSYLAGVDRVGSPAYSQPQLIRQSESVRRSADAVLVTAERLAIVPGSAARARGRCSTVTAPGPSISLPAGARGLALTASSPVRVALRRFASVSPTPVGTAPAGGRVDLPLPVDRSRQPWVVVLTPAPARLTACPIG